MQQPGMSNFELALPLGCCGQQYLLPVRLPAAACLPGTGFLQGTQLRVSLLARFSRLNIHGTTAQ